MTALGLVAATERPPSPRSDVGNVRSGENDRVWLMPLLVLFVVKGALLAAMIGPFTGHDEVDHFYYVARLAAGEGLGVVGEVDLPPETAPFRAYVADYPTNAEVIQPPFYHALLAPLYRLVPGGTETRLYALRLVSVPIGTVIVWLAYRTARLLFPAQVLIRAGVPIFVAFQPQFSFEAAIVNHDILLIALVSAVVYLTVAGLRDGLSIRRQWVIGILGGVGLWTKASFALVLPVVGAGVVLYWWNRSGSGSTLVGLVARTVATPVVLASPWFLRSLLLYGDPTGAARLRDIPGFGEQAQSYGEMIGNPRFWHLLLSDFWGNYGWRQVPIDPDVALGLWAVWGMAFAGWVVALARFVVARRRGRVRLPSRLQVEGVGLYTLLVMMYIFGVLYVGTIQFTQARFAFPAMIGVGLLTLLGLAGWLPDRWRAAALPVLAVGLLGFQVVVAIRFLLPFYYGPGGGAVITP